MKDRISITDLARLRNVTTETLRYYDRIGLFKPIYVDPNTKYRYYSILQYEKF
ncbi:MerR family DNA-binding transcriptional regulator [Clostridium tyrobutyricum]|uniref:MerR family DNA-binding transcriptional regulator n=1 Tax=Clostridium tyrobutyricum TaxID=1519 RepID=UPI0026E43316|nr:MerR family DNA-binding transcriptional regulator [Clostridium tyrobutyricum]